MKGRIVGDLVFTRDRKQRVTYELEGDFRETYDALKEVPVEVTVKKYREKRSLDANAYMWVLIDKLAVATGIKKRDIYFDGLRNVGGNTRHYCGIPEAIDDLCNLWAVQGSTGWGWPYDRYPSKLEGCENVKLFYEAKIARLEKQIEQEQEWKPYTDERLVSQEKYDHIHRAGHEMTDAEAIEWIAQEFGFAPEKIRINRAMKTFEVNRHSQLRTIGEIDRRPMYDATDWYYVFFTVAGWEYEAYNGDLNKI